MLGKVIVGALQSTEGVCITLALLWLAASRWLAFPATLDIPGVPGHIAPAYLFIIALMRIVPKLANPATTPFTPTVPAPKEAP